MARLERGLRGPKRKFERTSKGAEEVLLKGFSAQATFSHAQSRITKCKKLWLDIQQLL